uniref:Secreted protein n=1 Tax=Caenorhabditis tropicalis TaxID=1561998 RepID=A0A1I7UW83_9PELO
MIRFLLVVLLIVSAVAAQYEVVGETASISLPQTATYRRLVYVQQEHIYRVCNGKNAKTCGYWENIETKKQVYSGNTTYNKNQKKLVIKKMKQTDFGTYMTGNKIFTQGVYQMVDYTG